MMYKFVLVRTVWCADPVGLEGFIISTHACRLWWWARRFAASCKFLGCRMALVKCSECKGKVSDTAASCPHCGSPVSAAPATKGSGLAAVLVWSFALVVLVWACVPDGDANLTPEEAAAVEAERAEEKRKGFHCLSAWDGSHPTFKKMVIDGLRDPQSFEHIETRVSPVDGDGLHRIWMDYRAKNGFGGMNVAQATGVYANAFCSEVVLLASE